MSALSDELACYLASRRSMGFKLRRAEKLLVQFVQFCQELDVRLSPSRSPCAGQPPRRGGAGLGMPLPGGGACLQPPPGPSRRGQPGRPTNLVPHRPRSATPFLYTAEQVQALIAGARSFPSPVRQTTFETIIGLLWATGMRIGEALALDSDDVDLAHGVLIVREAKFGKSRELPLHGTTTAALAEYARHRARWFGQGTTDAFFVSAAGTRVLYIAISTLVSRSLSAGPASSPSHRPVGRGRTTSGIASPSGP